MTAPGVFTAVLPKGIIEDPAFTKWEEDLDGCKQPEIKLKAMGS
jgi:hypothetical protein